MVPLFMCTLNVTVWLVQVTATWQFAGLLSDVADQRFVLDQHHQNHRQKVARQQPRLRRQEN